MSSPHLKAIVFDVRPEAPTRTTHAVPSLVCSKVLIIHHPRVTVPRLAVSSSIARLLQSISMSQRKVSPRITWTSQCLFVQPIFISAFLIFTVGRTSRGPSGAWQKFERGELSLFSFYEQFGRDLSDTDNGNKWYAEYCARKKIGMASYTRTFLE